MQKNLYSSNELKNILQQKSLKVLVVGDACYDIYHYGEVKRISPEAPVPIFEHSYTLKKNGMAYNVIENFRALGVEPMYEVRFSEEKNRYIDIKTNYQLLRVDNKTDLNHDYNCSMNVEEYDGIVISDYDKGLVSYEFVEGLRKAYNGPIFIDTKKKDLKRFAGCIIKINEPEWNSRLSDHDDVIITRGSDSVKYKDKSYPVSKIQAYDVCGAGDTFLSSLVYGYLQTNNIDVGIQFAIRAAGVTVQHIGVYAPTLEEILS